MRTAPEAGSGEVDPAFLGGVSAAAYSSRQLEKVRLL